MRRIAALFAICLCYTATAAVADHHEGGDHPPMLVLMPPPDVEKPEGVEMTGDPEEDFKTVFHTFFRLMDGDGNGELSPDELKGWVHPPRMDGDRGEHMDGEGRGDGRRGERGERGDGERRDGERRDGERRDGERRDGEHMDGEHREGGDEVQHLRDEIRKLRDKLKELGVEMPEGHEDHEGEHE